MLGRLPQMVYPGRLAESGEILRGSIALETMPRLAEYLHDTEGDVDVELEFGIDSQRIKYVQGSLKTTLHLVCQRCLQSLDWPLELDVVLGFSASETAAQSMPGQYEPVVLEEPRLELGKLVEDELLLALPIVAMHPVDECHYDRQLIDRPGPSEEVRHEESRKPFAGLDEMLKHKQKKSN